MLDQKGIKDEDKIQDTQKNQRFAKIHKRGKLFIKKIIDEAQYPITSNQIKIQLQKEVQLKISQKTICQYLKEILGLQYKKLKPITFRHNLTSSKLQRQQAAKWFIENLTSGKRLINIDESTIDQTDKRQRGWFKQGQTNFISHSQRLSKINIISGVTNFGEYYFTMNIGINNSDTIIYFLLRLCKYLDKEELNWRQNTLIILDNAPYHRSQATVQALKDLKIPVMFLGPYQYKMAPIELTYSFIKNRNLNPLNSRGSTIKQASVLVKEMAFEISKLDFSWTKKAYSYILTHALEDLCLTDL